MSEPYQVLGYSKKALVGLFVGLPYNPEKFETIETKPQIVFLHEYCERRKIQTLVYESDYVDRHYSEDYNGYYVKCFTPYKKHCARIHFFQQPVPEEIIQNLLSSSTSTDLNDLGYHGFVVVKPLPETVIGRTYLAPPELSPATTGDVYLRERGYRPNLFGTDLRVLALPFQEQDHEVGACATSAVWTVLHGTAAQFENRVLAPLEITKRAYASRPHSSSPLPNDGLTMEQVAGVFRDIGLGSVVTSAANPLLLKSEASAYIRGKIPLILSLDFNLKKTGRRLLHAVAVTGVGGPSGKCATISHTDFRIRSSRIDRLFVHDDGVGPYCEIKIANKGNIVETAWIDNGQRKQARARELLIPLYEQIRVRFRDILVGVIKFHDILREEERTVGLDVLSRFEWDIFLSGPSDLKRGIAKATTLSTETRKGILTAGFPRFVWRVLIYDGDVPVAEFMFDATELRQGDQLIDAIFHDQGIENYLKGMATGYRLSSLDATSVTKSMIRELAGTSGDSG